MTNGRPPLQFTELQIRNMPGLRGHGFRLDGLAPGLNIIHGPNGSGKTTTARAVAALLWPQRDLPHAQLSGRCQLAGAGWSVTLDGGAATWYRDGVPAAAPGLPGASAKDRYYLSLKELLRAVDADLAQLIVQESVGGYDVAAAERARFGEPVRGRSAAANKLRDAIRRRKQAEQQQAEVRDKEQRLAQLQAELKEAQAEIARRSLLEQARRIIGLRSELAELNAALGQYPAWLGRLTGGEEKRLQELEQAIATGRGHEREAEQELRRGAEEVAATALADTGLAAHHVRAWRAQLDSLRQGEADRKRLTEELAKAQAALRMEAERLGGAVTAAAKKLDARAVEMFAELARESDGIQATIAGLKAERARLREALDGHQDLSAERLQQLQRGMLALTGWLQAPAPAAGTAPRRLAWLGLAAALLLGAGGAAAWLSGVAALGAALLGAGLVAGVMLWRLWPPAAADERGVHRRAYEQLGLASPASWQAADVVALFGRLQADSAQLQDALDKLNQERDVTRRLAEAEEAAAALRERQQAAARDFGLPGDSMARGLAWLADRLQAWQNAETEVGKLQAALQAKEQELTDGLAGLARELAAFGYGDIATLAAAQASLDELEQRLSQFESARRKREHAEDKRKRAEEELARWQQARTALLSIAGLAADDPDASAVFLAGCRRWPQYAELARKRDLLQAQLAQIEAEYAKAGGSPDWLEQPSSELDALLNVAAGAAERLQELMREQGRIEESIRHAKGSSDLEAALADIEEAEAELAALRRHETAQQLGRLLARHVIAQTRDRQRPPVFHRARDLFAAITRGQYALQLDDSGDEPAFVATETATGIGKSLDELSDGTRVQLLLAVRVAFIEVAETAVKLPLVLDEVLANSDDERAQAVMEAVLALVESGRQVLYFTAQRDEVSKWLGLLQAAPGVPHAVHDLAAIRQLARSEARPLPDVPVAPPAVPAPAGLSYGDYGKRLHVPALDRFADAGAAHLWHLLADGDELYGWLQQGVTTWGQLQALAQAGAAGAWPPPLRASYDRVAAAARALSAGLEAWRIGRGRPLDRQALAECGGVTPTFLDRVAALADAVGGDVRRLLAALADRQVTGFGPAALQKLKQALAAHGLLDEREPLSPQQIEAQMHAVVAGDVAAGQISLQLLQRLVHYVTAE